MSVDDDARHGELLDPPLPYRMTPRVRQAVGDVQLQQFVDRATSVKDQGRVDSLGEAFGDDTEAVRALAGRIKQHTLDHLDVYVERFVAAAESVGTQVHFAGDADDANSIVTAIARAAGCRLCVKSKSMVTEEIRLLPALEAAGVETIETDLGEFILQLDHDAPAHIVAPMIHKDRTAVGRAFVRELGVEYTDEPDQLTRIAREHLRDKYRHADLGISGGNFLLADSGSIVICTNEGNADFVVAAPRIHVAVVGIEKLVPTASHLPVFLKLLARSATAQDLTVYTTAVTGPRRPGDRDGPEAVHVVLVDNGRTGLLADDSRELLRCIRCGACLNTCPVFRSVGGGHAYGAVYSGPIGAVITPLLKGLANYPDLPQASSLCGACARACPVQIDLPKHLVRLREQQVDVGIVGWRARLAYRLWAACLRHPGLYRLATATSRFALRRLGTSAGKRPFDDRRWVRRLPGPLRGWTDSRDFPTPTAASFRSWWSSRSREDKP